MKHIDILLSVVKDIIESSRVAPIGKEGQELLARLSYAYLQIESDK